MKESDVKARQEWNGPVRVSGHEGKGPTIQIWVDELRHHEVLSLLREGTEIAWEAAGITWRLKPQPAGNARELGEEGKYDIRVESELGAAIYGPLDLCNVLAALRYIQENQTAHESRQRNWQSQLSRVNLELICAH